MFKRHGVYTETEVKARYEILMEEYSKIINIEALTMVDMVKKDYTPSISDYQKNLCDTVLAKKAVCEDMPCETETALLKKVSGLADKIFEKNNELDAALKNVPDGDATKVAVYYRNEVFSKMGELRELVDSVEADADREFWPVPSYGDIIFSVK